MNYSPTQDSTQEGVKVPIWTNPKEIVVIDFYKANPCLWQHGHPDRNHKHIHQELLESLQLNLSLEFSVREIKAKWRKLKDVFDRCVKKARQTDGQQGVVWHHFERMLPFLSTKEEGENLFDLTLEPTDHEKTRNSIGDFVHNDEPANWDQTVSQQQQHQVTSTVVRPAHHPALKLTIKREVDETDTAYSNTKQFVKRIRTGKSGNATQSPCACVEMPSEDHFGRHVASSLKMLPALQREQAKLDIQKLIYAYMDKNQHRLTMPTVYSSKSASSSQDQDSS